MNDPLNTVFQALADPTRRAILDQLRRGEVSAGDLAAPFDMSQPAVSRHLRLLRGAGLVTQRRVGTRRLFRLAPHRLMEIDAWLARYRDVMEGNYARLDALLEAQDSPKDEGETDVLGPENKR